MSWKVLPTYTFENDQTFNWVTEADVYPEVITQLNNFDWGHAIFVNAKQGYNIIWYGLSTSPFDVANPNVVDNTLNFLNIADSHIRIWGNGVYNYEIFINNNFIQGTVNFYTVNGGFALVPFVNHDTQKAIFVLFYTSYSWEGDRKVYAEFTASELGASTLYNALSQTPITYTWQSVPSISGKNGILQNLVQIKEEAINDGEPVSEATVLSFDSLGNINIPSIIDEQMPVDPSDVTSVTATYLIPALENGTYEGIKLLVKKGSIPTSEEDADKVVNLDEPTSILRIDSKSVGNLDEDSHYYFVVKLVDEIGTEATSDPKDIWTSHSEGWSFDYTGEIQTFVAPKTGIYQLETWGAQGGDATDGTNIARGGYGAYAYGEVLLNQGDTLYINVGGQNGYGGGGNGSVTYDVKNIAKTLDYEHIKSGSDITNLAEWYLTDWWLYFGQISQNRPFRYENNTFYCLSEDASTAQNVQVHTLVPIPRLYNAISIKFKIRRTQVRSGTQWNQLYLNFAHIGDNNSFSRDYIINVNSPVQEGNLIVTTPNLNEWYEFETGEINIASIDYVEFVRTFAGYDVKDIEITCST